MKPRLLDLYCGGGGAAKGYHDADFEVIGVDIEWQGNYPYDMWRSDAIDILRRLVNGESPMYFKRYPDNILYHPTTYHFSLRDFDAIHASPPCQSYTKKNENWGRKRVNKINYPDLIEKTRKLLIKTGKPYIIENVNGSPLNGTLMLCGTMFGLPIIKHRYFEFNWPMPILAPQTCNHSEVYNPWSGKGRSADKMREAMGIDWLPTSGGASRKAGYTGDLSNAIPPAYTEYIGKYLMEYLKSSGLIEN